MGQCMDIVKNRAVRASGMTTVIAVMGPSISSHLRMSIYRSWFLISIQIPRSV